MTIVQGDRIISHLHWLLLLRYDRCLLRLPIRQSSIAAILAHMIHFRPLLLVKGRLYEYGVANLSSTLVRDVKVMVIVRVTFPHNLWKSGNQAF